MNMPDMSVTELVSQSPMGSLKAWANYSAARDGRPCGVSSDVGARGRATTTTQRRKSSSNTRDGGTRTSNMPTMFVTELTSQSAMG